jgi:hypothetical protein
MRLPLAAGPAEGVAWLVGNLVPVKTDLSGRLAGWYRLHDAEGQLSPDSVLGDLAANTELVLHFVPNEIVNVEIVVEELDPPMRFVAPVGTATTIGSLMDHLAGWLGLPAGKRGLWVDGTLLGPHAILADVDVQEGAVMGLRLLPVRKAAAGKAG